MLLCPHCHRPAISALRKMGLGPAVPATCRSCGRKVGVPYTAATLAALPPLASMAFAFGDTGLTLMMAAIFAGTLTQWVLHIAWVPLESREPVTSSAAPPADAPAMRRTRPRFTVRGLMLAVALSAIWFALWRLRAAGEVYAERARGETSELARAEGELRALESVVADWTEFAEREDRLATAAAGADRRLHERVRDDFRARAERYRTEHRMRSPALLAKAAHHRGMRAKYERAARSPWLPVEPDPPEPK